MKLRYPLPAVAKVEVESFSTELVAAYQRRYGHDARVYLVEKNIEAGFID